MARQEPVSVWISLADRRQESGIAQAHDLLTFTLR